MSTGFARNKDFKKRQKVISSPMTNTEAYFRETEELESEMMEQERHGLIQHRNVNARQLLFGRHSYRREQLPSGCILYKLTAHPNPN